MTFLVCNLFVRSFIVTDFLCANFKCFFKFLLRFNQFAQCQSIICQYNQKLPMIFVYVFTSLLTICFCYVSWRSIESIIGSTPCNWCQSWLKRCSNGTCSISSWNIINLGSVRRSISSWCFFGMLHLLKYKFAIFFFLSSKHHKRNKHFRRIWIGMNISQTEEF